MKKVIYETEIELTGITPLLMHRCGVIETNKTKSSETSYDEEWMKTVYTSMNDESKLIVPSINLEAMMRDTAPGIKIGKAYLSKEITPGSDVVEFEVPLLYQNKCITVDDIINNNWILTQSVKVQKSRIMRKRAMIPIGWMVNFHIQVTNKIISQETLRDLLIKAGIKEGLMDWRPGSDKPGKFGQFDLTKFEIC